MKTRPSSIFKLFSVLLLSGIVISCSGRKSDTETEANPNIMLIVADDLGYGDIGCYGGEIQTPNIDELAADGVRFSSFHTAPMCAPTRAMLLSGNDNHIAGVGRQSTVTEEFGYEGRLTNRVVTIPSLLRDGGYHTYMTGKWHLGGKPESNPHNKGFEHSFVMIEGAGNHYVNKSALSKGNSKYTEDGSPAIWNDGDYSTDFYTDKMIEYIDHDRADNKPFFAYLAYTSPHWPLQVDRKYWEKYIGLYDDGYEELRARRLESLKASGIIPDDAQLPEIHKKVMPWSTLSGQEKQIEVRKMELYAGMVDNLDENIGRLFTYLREIGEYDKTLFVFMSDNGAAHRDFYYANNYSHLADYYNDDYENMGNADSYIAYGPQWAEAGSAPFRFFKDYATQGGINTTLIISGPDVNRSNEIHHGFLSLLDLAPTFYEMANVQYPDTYRGNQVYPLRGNSLLPYLSGESNIIHNDEYVFALEHGGNAMLRKGTWKITNHIKPFTIENFALYNLSNDLGEQLDLKESEPEKYQELLDEWAKFADEVIIKTPTHSAK